MSVDNNQHQKIAEEQVDAFMSLLQNRLGVEEQQIKYIVQAQARNGKTYVTWAWVIGILIILLGGLAGLSIQQANENTRRSEQRTDENIARLTARVDRIEDRQIDVRERLRVIERAGP